MKQKMENIFNIFNLFKTKNAKIFPKDHIGNRIRSNTEYSYEDYQDMLHTEFKKKMESKRNKTVSPLRIRGTSF